MTYKNNKSIHSVTFQEGEAKVTLKNTSVIIFMDATDFELVEEYSITLHPASNKLRIRARLPDNTRVEVQLSHFILGRPEGLVTYRDGNTLNLKRSNLQVETPRSVGRRRVQQENASGIKGVYWHKKNENWYSLIRYEDKNHHLGTFSTKEEAQKARLDAEKIYYIKEDTVTSFKGIEELCAKPTIIVPKWRLYRTVDDSIHMEDGTTRIPLTQDFWAIIYTLHFPLVCNYTWGATKGGNTYYASTNIRENGTPSTLFMHRLIMEAPEGTLVDHEDQDGLNNRKDNLRFCTKQENARNSKLSSDSTSGIKGVTWQKNRNYWEAHIAVNQKKIHLGSFQDKKDAIKARLEAETKIDPKFFNGNKNG